MSRLNVQLQARSRGFGVVVRPVLPREKVRIASAHARSEPDGAQAPKDDPERVRAAINEHLAHQARLRQDRLPVVGDPGMNRLHSIEALMAGDDISTLLLTQLHGDSFRGGGGNEIKCIQDFFWPYYSDAPSCATIFDFLDALTTFANEVAGAGSTSPACYRRSAYPVHLRRHATGCSVSATR